MRLVQHDRQTVCWWITLWLLFVNCCYADNRNTTTYQLDFIFFLQPQFANEQGPSFHDDTVMFKDDNLIAEMVTSLNHIGASAMEISNISWDTKKPLSFCVQDSIFSMPDTHYPCRGWLITMHSSFQQLLHVELSIYAPLSDDIPFQERKPLVHQIQTIHPYHHWQDWYYWDQPEVGLLLHLTPK